jgi:hypothetical protein
MNKQNVSEWMKKTGHKIADIAKQVREMPLKKKVLIGAGVAAVGLAGYMMYRYMFKKFDGVTYRLRAYTKSKETANEMAEMLREQGFNVRIVKTMFHNSVLHRIYIHKPKV